MSVKSSELRPKLTARRTETGTAAVTSANGRFERRDWFIAASLVVVTFICFFPALNGAFVQWDDNANFLENPYFRGLGPTNLRWMWSTFHMGHYVPLTWMTEGFDYTIWGMNSLGYHLTNDLLHCANTVLLYKVIRTLDPFFDKKRSERFSVRTAAALGALFFAIHPLRVESVAWITERRDVLSLFFELLSLLSYLRYTRDSARTRFIVLAVVLYICALLSKATVMTLPAVLLILNVYPLRRLSLSGWRTYWRNPVIMELLPFAVLSVSSIALSMIALRPPHQLPLSGKVAVSAYSFMFYLWKLALPFGLAPLYEMPRHLSAGELKYLISYAVSVVVLAVVLYAGRIRPAFLAACLIYIVAVSPMLGVVQNGPQIVADRYTYHAGPALAVLFGYACAGAMARWGLAATVFVCAAFTALAGLTWRQSTVWQTSATLWERVAAVNDTSSIAETALGVMMLNNGLTDSAIVHLRKATIVDPGYAESHNNLGNALVRVGDLEGAFKEYQSALAARPEFSDALANLGVMYARRGEFERAIEFYRKALVVQPERVEAMINWGNALLKLGKPDEARKQYARAIELRPDVDDAELNWGVALAQQGRLGESIEHFRRALDINPANEEAGVYLRRALEGDQRQRNRP